jgi:hypothetical protein
MTSTTDTTITQSIVVNAPLEDAFRAFTERFGDFKPREHNLMSSPPLDVGELLHHGGNGSDLVVGGAVGLIDPQDHGSALLGGDVPEFFEVAEGAQRWRSPASP